MEIFRLFGTVFLKDQEANQGLDKIDKKAEGVGSRLGDMIKTAAKWGAGMVAAAGAAAAALFALAGNAAESADKIDKMSIRTGISFTRLQELKYASGQVGVEFETLTGAVGVMTRMMLGAEEGGDKQAEAFKRLGVQTTDAGGKMRNTGDVFNQTLLALAGMENKTERNAIAMRLFGRGAIEIVPLLDAGTQGIADLSARAHDLNLVITDEAITAGVKFGDSLDDVKKALGAVFTQIGLQLMPVLQTMLDWILGNMPQIQAVFAIVFGFMAGVIDDVKWAWSFMVDGFRDEGDPNALLGSWWYEIYQLGVIAKQVFDVISLAVAGAVAWFKVHLLPVLTSLWALVKESMPGIQKIVVTVFTIIWENVQRVWDIFHGYLLPIIEDILKIFGKLLDWVRPHMPEILKIIESAFDLIGTAVKTVVDIFDLLAKSIRTAWNWLTKWNSTPAEGKSVGTDGGGSGGGTGSGSEPQMAEGGYIPYRPGGTLVRAAEAGEGEWFIPESKMGKMGGLAGAGAQPQVLFARGSFDGAVIMDDYGVDRLMSRVVDRLGVLGVKHE